MAIDLEQLVIPISVDTKALRKQLDAAEGKTRGSAGGMAKSMGKLKDSVKNVAAEMFSLRSSAAIAAGATGLLLLGRNAISTAAALANTADKLGVNIELLQELRFAGEQVNVSQQTVDLSLQRFVRRLGEARQGQGELLGVIKQYNIALVDSEGRTRSTEAVLGSLADTIAGAGDQNEKLRISFKAFDSEGAALVNVLQRGSTGLNAMRQRARDLGAVLGEDLVKDAQKADTEIKAFTASIKANLTKGLIEGFVGEFDKLGSIIKDPDFQKGVKAFGTNLASTIKFAADNKETLAVLAGIAVGAKTGSMFSAPGAILGGVVGGGITAQKTGGFEKLGVGLSHFISGITGLDDEIEELTKDFVKVEKAAAAAAGDADSSGAGAGGLAGVSEATKTLIKDLREEVSWLKLEARRAKGGRKIRRGRGFC